MPLAVVNIFKETNTYSTANSDTTTAEGNFIPHLEANASKIDILAL